MICMVGFSLSNVNAFSVSSYLSILCGALQDRERLDDCAERGYRT